MNGIQKNKDWLHVIEKATQQQQSLKNTRRGAGVLIYLQHLFRNGGDPPQSGGFKWLNYQKSAIVMEPGSSLGK